MTRLDEARGWLEANLGTLAEKFQVPGASAAVLSLDSHADAGGSDADGGPEAGGADGGEGATSDAAAVATGVLNRATGVAATPDSLFQIGSITKLWTTTLALQLVDEDKLDLDAPVRDYLPGFRVSDPDATRHVTVRHLLTHTSGFEGDVFRATTRGDDAVQRFVADVLPTLGQPVPLGSLYSYNNAGFVLLGRLIEVLRGRTWAEALRAHLAEPLGLTEVATDADEAILGRAAVGHIRADAVGNIGAEVEQPFEPAGVWALPHSNAPAGSMLAMSARAALGLARLYLADGVAPDGVRLLSSTAIRQAWEHAVDVPRAGFRSRQWGLGWAIDDWGRTVVGHNGATVGQEAYFRVVPGAGVAVALLTNGGCSTPLFHAVFSRLLGDLADVRVPDLPAPPASPASPVPPAKPAPAGDPARYVGTYEVEANRIEVFVDPAGEDSSGSSGADRAVDRAGAVGGLRLRSTALGELAELQERAPTEYALVRLDGDSFVATELEQGAYPVWTFVGSDDAGRARYLHNGRALPRIR